MTFIEVEYFREIYWIFAVGVRKLSVAQGDSESALIDRHLLVGWESFISKAFNWKMDQMDHLKPLRSTACISRNHRDDKQSELIDGKTARQFKIHSDGFRHNVGFASNWPSIIHSAG